MMPKRAFRYEGDLLSIDFDKSDSSILALTSQWDHGSSTIDFYEASLRSEISKLLSTSGWSSANKKFGRNK